MSKVITQTEIMKYKGSNTIDFPEGTIVTPSAKDWAKEHSISINIKNPALKNSKMELLNKVIKATANNMDKRNKQLSKENLFMAVSKSIEKLGCRIY